MSGDPHWDKVQLLTGYENMGVIGVGFTEDSSFTRILDPNFGTDKDLVVFKFGAVSAKLDGIDDDLKVVHTSAFDLTDQDFTIETWLRFDGAPTLAQQIFSRYDNGSNQRSWFFRMGVSNNLEFYYYLDGVNANIISIPWTPSTATWYHVAVTREGTGIKLWVDGTQIGATHNVGTGSLFSPTSEPLRLGTFESTTLQEHFKGWFDEGRITIGVARYTNTFTAPTEAFPRGALTTPPGTKRHMINSM